MLLLVRVSLSFMDVCACKFDSVVNKLDKLVIIGERGTDDSPTEMRSASFSFPMVQFKSPKTSFKSDLQRGQVEDFCVSHGSMHRG